VGAILVIAIIIIIIIIIDNLCTCISSLLAAAGTGFGSQRLLIGGECSRRLPARPSQDAVWRACVAVGRLSHHEQVGALGSQCVVYFPPFLTEYDVFSNAIRLWAATAECLYSVPLKIEPAIIPQAKAAAAAAAAALPSNHALLVKALSKELHDEPVNGHSGTSSQMLTAMRIALLEYGTAI